MTGLQVATFPWDPKEAAPTQHNTPTVPSNAGNTGSYNASTSMNQPAASSQLPAGMREANGPVNPHIKQEPQDESRRMNNPVPVPRPSYQPTPGSTTAAQNAAAHLSANYGNRAAESIAAITSGMRGNQPTGAPQQPNYGQQQMQSQQQNYSQMSQQQMAYSQAAQQQAMQNMRGQMPMPMQQRQPHLQQPGPQMSREQYNKMMSEQQELQKQQSIPGAGGQGQGTSMTTDAYRKMMAEQSTEARQRILQAQGQQRMQTQNPQNGQQNHSGLPKSQHDGAGDMDDSAALVMNGDQVMGTVEIDNFIRSRIEANGRAMEGGGLFLPLSQANKLSKKKARKGKGVAAAQVDGGDEDDDDEDLKKEDVDEDAINSDLDDPDDGQEDEDEDEDGGHIMLCVYDKVQRVKNKWYVSFLAVESGCPTSWIVCLAYPTSWIVCLACPTSWIDCV